MDISAWNCDFLDILYTPPIRHLLDAMRYNGIQTRFYVQFFAFTILIFCFTVFVGAVVDLPYRNSGRLSWFLRAGDLALVDMLARDSVMERRGTVGEERGVGRGVCETVYLANT